MALTTFHSFPLLPSELRRKIYMMATPPRVVDIYEFIEVGFKDFVEECRTTPVQIKLDPSLTYFAFH